MRNQIKRLSLLCALTLAPSLAMATTQGRHSTAPQGTLLSAVACNASAANRTLSLSNPDGYGVAILQFDFTYNAATAITLTCNVSLDGGTTYAPLQSCAVSSGVCTSTDASWSKAVSANDDWAWRIDFLSAPNVQCTVACTGGGASDTVTVYGRLTTP